MASLIPFLCLYIRQRQYIKVTAFSTALILGLGASVLVRLAFDLTSSHIFVGFSDFSEKPFFSFSLACCQGYSDLIFAYWPLGAALTLLIVFSVSYNATIGCNNHFIKYLTLLSFFSGVVIFNITLFYGVVVV